MKRRRSLPVLSGVIRRLYNCRHVVLFDGSYVVYDNEKVCSAYVFTKRWIRTVQEYHINKLSVLYIQPKGRHAQGFFFDILPSS